MTQTTSFRTATGHYLRVYRPDIPRSDGREGQLLANAEAVGPDETFTIVQVPYVPGKVGIRIWGRYLSAQPDGRVEANREVLDIWEQWTPVRSAIGGWGFKSHFGQFLVAEGGGGGEVFANRPYTQPAEWETFRLDGFTGLPGLQIAGQLTVDRNAFVAAGQPFLPASLHALDLIGQGMRFGVDHIRPVFALARRAGYSIIRSGFQHYTDGGWWADKPVSKWDPRDNLDRFQQILDVGADHGLRWHLVALGLKGLRDQDETAIFEALRDTIADRGVGPESIALLEAANEVRDTGDADDQDPRELQRLLRIVSAQFPRILTALSSFTGTEDRETLRRYTPPSQPFYYYHAQREGRAHDKIRHVFSMGYSGESPAVRWLGIAGEPWGVGRLVSATEHAGEMDRDTMVLGAAIAAMSRQWWTFMSSPGVIYNYTGERFEDMPGFFEVPEILSRLPQDLLRWPVLNHSGPSRKGLRLHAVRRDAPNVRADYAIDPPTGRFVEVVYGPPEEPKDLPRERPIADAQVLWNGPRGRVTVGRLA